MLTLYYRYLKANKKFFGALVMGAGMGFVVADLGAILGMTSIVGMVNGIIIGLLGILLEVFAYPMYSRVLKKNVKR